MQKRQPGGVDRAEEGRAGGARTILGCCLLSWFVMTGDTSATAQESAGASKQDATAAIEKLQRLGGMIQPIAAESEKMEAKFHLSGKEIGDEGLQHLQQIPHLVWLNLRGTNVTDAGMPHVAKCVELTNLQLAQTAVSNSGLAELANLPSLEILNLYGTQVTDQGLESLQGMQSLRKLYLWQTKVTPEGAERLQASLPELEIVLGTESTAGLAEQKSGEPSGDPSPAKAGEGSQAAGDGQ